MAEGLARAPAGRTTKSEATFTMMTTIAPHIHSTHDATPRYDAQSLAGQVRDTRGPHVRIGRQHPRVGAGRRRPVRMGPPTARDGAVVARRAHNPKVGGSNPSPATKQAMKTAYRWTEADERAVRPAGNGRLGVTRRTGTVGLVVRAGWSHPFPSRTRS
jgi:hypothetical protein